MRKKILIVLTVVVLLFNILPVEALAAVGSVLSEEELNRAYALTGLGTGGLRKNAVSANAADGLFHTGMKPNLSWNASQLIDWMEETLNSDMNSVTDSLSRLFFTIANMEETRPESYLELMNSTQYKKALDIYTAAENLREEMRWLLDRLETASNVIDEMRSRMEERGDGMFVSDQVRLSARIEDASEDITEVRKIVAENYDGWVKQIEKWQKYLNYGTAGPDDEPWIGDWVTELFTEEEPVTDTATANAVKLGSSRMDRLSSAAGLVRRDIDVRVTVITENEVAVSLRPEGSAEGLVNAPVWVGDALNPDERDKDMERYYTNDNGTVVVPVNKFKTDEYDIVHLTVTAELADMGYQDFHIDDLDLAKGDGYTAVITPLGGDAANGSREGEAEPYIYSATLNGKDIMFAEYEMLYSPLNNVNFEIKVELRNPSGGELPDLWMSWYENNGSFSKLKQCWAQGTRNGNVYTFKGKWKQKFSPNADKKQRPCFHFGKDGKKVYSQLVSCRGATEEPLSAGTGAEGGVFANVLGKGMSMGFTVPVIDVGIGLNLPFQEYIPRLSINPAGYVVIYIGKGVFKDALEDSVLNWESKDARKFSQAQDWVERKGAFANYKAQYNLARDYYKAKFWKFIGESSIDIGIFAVATGRWQLDNDNPDVKSTDVVLRTGSGITVTYEYSWTVSYPIGPVPVYVCFTIGVYAGFSIEHRLSFCWVNGQFHNWSFKPYNELNIHFGFYVSAQLGVGIKGFLEAWVKTIACLDVEIKLTIFDDEPSSVSVSASIELAVGATCFFFSARKNWLLKDWPLYPKSDNLLNSMMNAGGQEKDAGRQEAAYGEPQRYPKLDQAAEVVLDTLTDAKPGIRIARAKNQTFVFYINTVTGPDGETHKRICWNNETNHREGTLEDDLVLLYWTIAIENAGSFKDKTKQQKLNELRAMVEDKSLLSKYNYPRALKLAEEISLPLDSFQGMLLHDILTRDDYAFDVFGMGDYVAVVGTCARKFDGDGYPVPGEYIDSAPNLQTWMLILEPDEYDYLSYRLSVTGKDRDGNVHNYCVDAGFAAGYGSENFTHEAFTNPHITWADIVWRKEGQEIKQVRVYCELEKFVRPNDADQSAGMNYFQYEGFSMQGLQFYSDRPVVSGKGKDWERVSILSETRGTNEYDYGWQSQSFVALSRPKNRADDGSADSAIELYDWRMNAADYYQDGLRSIVLEEGKIDSITMLEPRYTDDIAKMTRIVFYTLRETNADGDGQPRLYSLCLEPVKAENDDRDLSFRVTKRQYDMTVPTGKLCFAWLGGSPCLYWASAAQGEDDETLWRIWMMVYDMEKDEMTEPTVYAEFTLPNFSICEVFPTYKAWTNLGKGVIQTLMLTGTGTGYLTMAPEKLSEYYQKKFPSPVILCSFRELLQPAATLQTVIPKDLAIKAGDFEDMTLGIMNEGNIGISTFDISLYTVEDGRESAMVENVHVNCVEPKKSKITLLNGNVEMTGEQVAYRNDDFDFSSRRSDWVLSHETKVFTAHVGSKVELVSSEVTEPANPRYIKSGLLIPGSLAAWSTAFKIPENWKDLKTLRFRISAISVDSNWVRAIMNTGGAAAEAEANDAPAELRYVLNEETGMLELQTDALQSNAVRGAVSSGLLAREIPASSTDLEILLNDIDVTHRVYKGSDGERQLDIVVRNNAATRESLKLSCAVYVDGSTDATWLSLPYYTSATASHKTHTITLPVSSLVENPEKHSTARVVVSVVGDNDRVYTNNEFQIFLGSGNNGGLMILQQPEDAASQPGGTVHYTVGVSGGTEPYTYQWEVCMGENQPWQRLEGSTAATLTVSGVTLAMSGWTYRVIVTDAAGHTVTSRAARLTVTKLPLTGDRSPSVWLYLALAAAALILLSLYRRRFRKS